MMNNENFVLLRSLDALTFVRISVEFSPSRDLSQKSWIGAAIRNRFLYAAEQIRMPEGDSLRERLDTLSLAEDHFLYKQLRGGFPKGYLFDVSSLSHPCNEYTLHASEAYKFHILLIGRLIQYQSYVISAAQNMLREGLGAPMVSLNLISLNVSRQLRLHDFAKRCFDDDVIVRFSLKTPVALTKPVEDVKTGYQSRLNGFPSFYQWVSAAAYRLSTLTILYAEEGMPEIKSREEWEVCIEQFIAPAVRQWLLSADLKYISLRSTPKEDSDSVYVMSGYVGAITYGRVSPYYVPLVCMMSQLAIGNDVNYGFGRYQCTPYNSKQ